MGIHLHRRPGARWRAGWLPKGWLPDMLLHGLRNGKEDIWEPYIVFTAAPTYKSIEGPVITL